MASTLEAQLHAFRAAHRSRRAVFAGARWSYFVAGAGPETVLLLPGAPGIAEMAFPYILALEAEHRVIAPSYPGEVGEAGRLLAGLEALLAAEGAGPVHLVGASYSGLVAQCLLAQSPAVAGTLLIGDTGVATPGRGRALARLSDALARLPPAALHGALYGALAYVLAGPTPAHRFWRRYFRGVVAALTGAAAANRARVMAEIDLGGPWGGQPWRGPTLLMETVHDPLFSPRERAALRGRFPHAEHHTFHSRGHITALTRAPEYIAVMRAFLARHRG
jgi:pimeloyl-ACP methyl ester carboxylesterase